MSDTGDLESRVERLEQLIVELRAELAEARRDTAMAHELIALRGRRGGGTAEPPETPATGT
jgi:hypothetical protein